MNVRFKGISFIRYVNIFIFFKKLGFRFNPFSSKTITWGSKYLLEKDNVVRIEDGFIRSVGLGVENAPPLSLVFDYEGIYYDATKPSDLENILNYNEFDDIVTNRASAIRIKLVELGVSKYNVGVDSFLDLPLNKNKILVPGQVESDASIIFGSSKIKNNWELLKRVRDDNPDSYIIYKPHPDVLSGERDNGQWDFGISKYADLCVFDIAIDKLLNLVNEVHTITSLTGFEALLRGKPVTTYGMPFYAGWGLTRDIESCSRRKRILSIEELIAGVLITYPIYIDPYNKELCDVERVIDIIVNKKSMSIKSRKERSFYHFVDVLKKSRKLMKKIFNYYD
ncbi:hypothetical protein AB4564_14215 [Vibrio sp. 10N.222.51.E8]|uniref:capsular polysaccharide export protein, LipB/KpsS family n=1 Tax=unclassified Vibrio TaxID=2614977 RepID=UPI0019D23C94|nr:hypothetical protein [Vibrio sp. F13]